VSGIATASNAELKSSWTLEGGDYVCQLAVDEQASLCVAGLGNGFVLGLNPRDGKEKFRIHAHEGSVLGVTMAPNGKAFATCGQDSKAKLWNADGLLLAELPAEDSSWVEHIAWSPKGGRIAMSAGRRIRVWSENGTPLLQSDPLESTVTGIAWRADGSSLAAICYGGVRIIPFLESIKHKHLPWKGSLISMAWSPDAKVIACGSQDSSVHFWRIASGQDSEMSGYPFKPKHLAWDNESKLLATSGDATITVWDFRGKGPEGSRPLQLTAHKGLCTSLAFSHQKGMLASGSQDSSIIIWHPRRTLTPVRFTFLEDEVTALRWSDEDRLLIGADATGKIAGWNID
jgi:WD40 repeat protein